MINKGIITDGRCSLRTSAAKEQGTEKKAHSYLPQVLFRSGFGGAQNYRQNEVLLYQPRSERDREGELELNRILYGSQRRGRN